MEGNYVEEKQISNMPSYVSCEVLQKLVSYMKSKICKITMSDEGPGTGFFCKLPNLGKETLKALITIIIIIEKYLEIKKYIYYIIQKDKK